VKFEAYIDTPKMRVALGLELVKCLSSFREAPMPEVRFPRTSALGSSLNRVTP
jgi:hypothetical protein